MLLPPPIIGLISNLGNVADDHDLIDLLPLEAAESRSQMLNVFVNVSDEAEFHGGVQFPPGMSQRPALTYLFSSNQSPNRFSKAAIASANVAGLSSSQTRPPYSSALVMNPNPSWSPISMWP